MSMRIVSLVLVSFLWMAGPSLADHWPQWRGPQANGVAQPGNYPVEFSSTTNVRWKVALPGRGASTPVVWGNHIFVTAPGAGRDTVLCFDRDGNELWRTALGPQSKSKHKTSTSANPSPVTDGQRVYVYFRSGLVAALDFSGEVVWKDNLQKRFGESTLWWDLGTSPVLTRDHLVIAVMQAGDSYVVALDRASGAVAWKEPRMFDCARESDQAYTTPAVVFEDGKERIICWGADHLTGHDAADGKMLWFCGGFNPKKRPTWPAMSSPVAGDGIAVLSYGRGRGVAGIDLREAIPEDQRWLWRQESIGSSVPTPAMRDGQVYVVKENGRIACLDAGDGSERWTARLPSEHGTFYASPVLAGELIYYCSLDGIISVGRVGDTFKLLATNSMDEEVAATPIALDGELLVRGFQHLFCIRADSGTHTLRAREAQASSSE